METACGLLVEIPKPKRNRDKIHKLISFVSYISIYS